MNNKILSFSICIPVYKGSTVLKQAIKSILNQHYPDLEIIIGDDNPPELKNEIQKTKNCIASFHDKRIIYFKNPTNVGCQENLNRIVARAKKDIVYLVAQDDIVAINSLEQTNHAFYLDSDIGAVTRAYFWFDDDFRKPIRVKKPVDKNTDAVVSIFDDPKKIATVFNTVDNITGLAFRRKYLTTPFHNDMFTTHIYPFAAIFKKHKIVCLKDYIFACRIKMSQSRQGFAYAKSPMQSWIDMFNTVFPEKKYRKMRETCIRDFVATNYVGLVQIRNYARYTDVLHEIFLLIKYRWKNLFHPFFWIISMSCLIVPRKLLIPLTDWYKHKIHSLAINSLTFRY